MTKFIKRMFAADGNQVAAADVAPAISIDNVNRLVENINKLREVLGVTEMQAMAEGNTINIYATSVGDLAAQPDEGDEIALTEVTRALAGTKTITLKKYRKRTTAEAVQKAGRQVAINETDEALIAKIRKAVKADFFSAINPVSGTTAGTAGATLQAALANTWAKLYEYYEDVDAEPVYFVNPSDVATYLGGAQITTQEAFGFRYVEDFLGLGTVIFAPTVSSGTVLGTAKQNLKGAYVPAGGDVAQLFGLSFDESGLVGMNHFAEYGKASVDTLIMTGVTFYPQVVAGIVKTSIGEASL